MMDDIELQRLATVKAQQTLRHEQLMRTVGAQVRRTLTAIRSAEAQLQANDEARQLATRELEQAEARFAAGHGDNLARGRSSTPSPRIRITIPTSAQRIKSASRISSLCSRLGKTITWRSRRSGISKRDYVTAQWECDVDPRRYGDTAPHWAVLKIPS